MKYYHKERKALSYYIFGLSFMIFSFLSTTLLSPIIKTSATEETASHTAGPNSISMSSENSVVIDITPSSEQTIYTGINTLGVTNTCDAGATITLTTNSNLDTSTANKLIRSNPDNRIREINPTTGNVLTDYSWGYSVNDGINYYAVPAKNETPAIIYNSSAAAIDIETVNVKYGIKIDNSLPSGEYINDVIYTVAVKPACLTYTLSWDLNDGTGKTNVSYEDTQISYGSTINLKNYTPTRDGYVFNGWSNGSSTFTGNETTANINPDNVTIITLKAEWIKIVPMQSFSCADLSIGQIVAGKDTRDNNIYTIKKLADDRCWMTQNLRIINKTISSEDSNLPDGETWTIPRSSTSGFSTQNTNYAYYKSSTYGSYYAFYTATAGWGTDSITSGNSPKDICPKGWRLPTKNEFNTVYGYYKSAALMRGEPGFIGSGFVANSQARIPQYGYFWSSTVYDKDNAYSLYINSSSVDRSKSVPKFYGYAIRCIDREKTINEITYMQEMTTKIASVTEIDTTASLIDSRDNNIYTIRKLKDNNVWMTQNLRIINKTISGEDSNLPNGETWTIPASSISGFSETNTNNAYYIAAHGGYYTYYTATAGWGTYEERGSAAPKDICPKGWRLPYYPPTGDYGRLFNNYKSLALMQGDPGFTLSGLIYQSTLRHQGTNGYYMASDNISYNTVGALVLDSAFPDNYRTNNVRKEHGVSVRCIAK